ncbi:hypothetical protein SMICM304S_04739 [Streptomyces microflavus]
MRRIRPQPHGCQVVGARDQGLQVLLQLTGYAFIGYALRHLPLDDAQVVVHRADDVALFERRIGHHDLPGDLTVFAVSPAPPFQLPERPLECQFPEAVTAPAQHSVLRVADGIDRHARAIVLQLGLFQDRPDRRPQHRRKADHARETDGDGLRPGYIGQRSSVSGSSTDRGGSRSPRTAAAHRATATARAHIVAAVADTAGGHVARVAACGGVAALTGGVAAGGVVAAVASEASRVTVRGGVLVGVRVAVERLVLFDAQDRIDAEELADSVSYSRAPSARAPW